MKNLMILLVLATTLVIGCKKESVCTERGNYNVKSFELKINSNNRGLFKGEGTNTETTIGSTRNQWMFIPEKSYIAINSKSSFNFDFFNTAYADCIVQEISLTSFDASKTKFSVDRDLDLSIFGLESMIIPAGYNLLAVQSLRAELLKDIADNVDLHAGIEIPISVSKDFLIPLNEQKIKFTLEIVTTSGNIMSSTVDVVVDVKV